MKNCQRTSGEKFSLSGCPTPAVTVADIEDSSPARLGPIAAQRRKSQKSTYHRIPIRKGCRRGHAGVWPGFVLVGPMPSWYRACFWGLGPGELVSSLRFYLFSTFLPMSVSFSMRLKMLNQAEAGKEALHTLHVHRHSLTHRHTQVHTYMLSHRQPGWWPLGGWCPWPLPSTFNSPRPLCPGGAVSSQVCAL